MSEKRRPELVVRYRFKQGRNLKVEVFDGSAFPRKLFVDVFGDPLPDPPGPRYRLRVNGVWMPRRIKVLYTPDELEVQLAELARVPLPTETKL
jgi:hypothetical protein